MERRNTSVSSPSPLPLDYIKMVNEVFNTHFEESLKLYNKIKPLSRFEATGEVYPNEIVIAISLVSEGVLAATTVYTSIDFDPKEAATQIQDLLSDCVDAAASIFATYLSPENPEKMEMIANDSLSAMEDAPFHWTLLELNKKKVYVKMDKSNPGLDSLANDWLRKNDPKLH